MNAVAPEPARRRLRDAVVGDATVNVLPLRSPMRGVTISSPPSRRQRAARPLTLIERT